jgi:hypothetical protein
MNLKVFNKIPCLKANFYIFGEILNANMKHIALVFLLLSGSLLFGQTLPEGAIPTRVNEQRRYTSDSRLFYIWNEQKDAYDLRDTEYESSIIDIREINTHTNGYIVISLTDDGKTRLYHGSIISFSVDDDGNSTWVMRSKNARGKLVLNPKKKIFTYSYESNEQRYVKIFVFNLQLEETAKDE